MIRARIGSRTPIPRTIIPVGIQWPHLWGKCPPACVLLLTAVVAFTTGCQSTLIEPVHVNTQDQAAAVLVSVSNVASWDQVAAAMEPKFSLTGDQAVKEVLPVTQRIGEQVLNAFGASLGYATAHGTESAPTVPTPPSGTPAGAQSLGVPSTAGDIGVDPMLQYQTALGLFESVQMMNREIQNAAVLQCYVPFLVRLKLAVIPYRPNLGYTIHTRIAFFPNESEYGVGMTRMPRPRERDIDTGTPPTPMKKTPTTASKPDASYSSGDDGVNSGVRSFPTLEPSQTVISSYNPASSSGASGTHTAPSDEGQRQRPTACNDGDYLPEVIPLLATDDIERALKSRSVEVANQISAALTTATPTLSRSLGFNSLHQSLKAISGQDYNSRLTVARQSENTLYVRIGASDQATAGGALLPQNYDVALLLLAPRAYFLPTSPPTDLSGGKVTGQNGENSHKEDTSNSENPVQDDNRYVARSMAVVTYTKFRDAETGDILDNRPPQVLIQQFDQTIQTILAGPTRWNLLKRWHQLSPIAKERLVRTLAAPIQTNDIPRFRKILFKEVSETQNGAAAENGMSKGSSSLDRFTLNGICKDNTDVDSELCRRTLSDNLWTAMSSILSDTAMKSGSFLLRSPEDIRLVPEQTALVLDDGKSKAQVQLQTLAGRSTTSLLATLNLATRKIATSSDTKSKEVIDRLYHLLAQKLSLDPATHVLSVSFPSPEKWGIKIKDIDTDSRDTNVTIDSLHCDQDQLCSTLVGGPMSFRLLMRLQTSSSKPGFELAANVSRIVANKHGGKGTVMIRLSKLQPGIHVTLALNGADIVSAVDGSTSTNLPIKNSSVTILKNTTVTFNLANLSPGSKITVKAQGKRGDESTGTATRDFAVVSI